MKTLSIGDIHGRDTWKDILFGSSFDYTLWREAYISGAPFNWNPDLPFLAYDEIIFIGDYVDSFDIPSPIILKNLEEIIDLKKILGERIVLLLGNHDIHYFVNDNQCSGYRPDMKYDLEDIFRKNEDLFKMAHQDGRYLWTHAGVRSLWLRELRECLYDKRMRFRKVLMANKPVTIADEINMAWSFRLYPIFYVDPASGGSDPYGGPLWVRPSGLGCDPIPGMTQIVGHTAMSGIKSTLIDTAEHWYIDVLHHSNDALTLNTNGIA
jgi:predicted MPP superfamily phosphohydrolase